MNNYRRIRNYGDSSGESLTKFQTRRRSRTRRYTRLLNEPGERTGFGARQQILENSFNEKTGGEKEELSDRAPEGRGERERRRSEGGEKEKRKKMEFAHDRRIPDEYQ